MIIALCGLAGSGKTTAANHLVREHNFARMPFAYTLKSMISHGFGISGEILDGPSAGKEVPLEIFEGKTLREVMQSLGTEWGRNLISENLWVNAWVRSASQVPNVVVDDARFPNELAAIRRLGGRVVMLRRPGAGTKINPTHASERPDELDPDFIVNNTGSIDDLLAWFDAFIEHRVVTGMAKIQEVYVDA